MLLLWCIYIIFWQLLLHKFDVISLIMVNLSQYKVFLVNYSKVKFKRELILYVIYYLRLTKKDDKDFKEINFPLTLL